MTGNIIVINGGSSFGKTTLARALQGALREPHLLTGGDIFFLERPPFFLTLVSESEPLQGEGFRARKRGDSLHEVEVGPLALKWHEEMFHLIGFWADRGNHVIVDTVLYERGLVEGMRRGLGNRPVLHVGIHCPLETAIAWEQSRADRLPGGAAYFHGRVHGHYAYDLEIDTSATVTADAVQMIVAALEKKGFAN